MARVGLHTMIKRRIGVFGALVLLACLGRTADPPADPSADAAKPIPLPVVDLAHDAAEVCSASDALVMLPPVNVATLLPPQELPADCFTEWSGDATLQLVPLPPLEPIALPLAADATVADLGGLPPEAEPEELPSTAPDGDHDDAHTADARLLLADASPSATGLPTDAIVTERAQAKIRRGYALAQRGANYAARSEFLQVLRMIAEAKDHAYGERRRTTALANGLRALDEATDFAARAPDADSDLSLNVIISAHRTPIAKTADLEELLPQQLADLYFRYAQLQLGASVAGEPAGSMALHALGKLYSQLGRVEPGKNNQADRRAFALQQAALLARNDNHLAAHELGVLLAESGHYAESEHLLAQVAAQQPHAVVFRNLARIQHKLGRTAEALYYDDQARILASRDPSMGGQVTWVRPDALAGGHDLSGAGRPSQVASRSAPPQSPPTNSPAARPRSNDVARAPGGWIR